VAREVAWLALACSFQLSGCGLLVGGSLFGVTRVPVPADWKQALYGQVRFSAPDDHALANLTGGVPLSAVKPLSVAKIIEPSPVGYVTQLDEIEPINAQSPVLNFDVLVSARYRVQAVSQDAALFVEAVDPETGKLLGRVQADEKGRFEVSFPKTNLSAIMVQATGIRGNTVMTYLAAPVRLPEGQATRKKVDLSAGSTVISYAAALEVGARGEFDVASGFRGLKSSTIAKLLAAQRNTDIRAAAAALDASPQLKFLTSPGGFEHLVISPAALMANTALWKALPLEQTTPMLAAAHGSLLSKLGTGAAAPTAEDAIVDAARALDEREIRQLRGEPRQKLLWWNDDLRLADPPGAERQAAPQPRPDRI